MIFYFNYLFKKKKLKKTINQFIRCVLDFNNFFQYDFAYKKI